MNEQRASAASLYDYVLRQGRDATNRYYGFLRDLGLSPTPAEREGFLFNPNPVILPQTLVWTIHEDLERFCEERKRTTQSAEDLLATMPSALRQSVASTEVADHLLEQLHQEHPISCIDCFLVETPRGLEPRYLEWQTFPAYTATALFCLEGFSLAFDELEEKGALFSPIAGESLASLKDRVRTAIVGKNEDARQVVIVDYRPEEQETSFEFELSVRLTGGEECGVGVIDPRQIRYVDALPCYKRNDSWIPIKSAFSRIVYGDLSAKLVPECSTEELAGIRRFFNDTKNVNWRVHPIHFLYGTKGDLPHFQEKSLSPFIPSSQRVNDELIRSFERENVKKLEGFVQKPVDGHGGMDLLEDPLVSELVEGSLLQERIHAAAFHQTLDGMMSPEIRVMSIPNQEGRLEPTSVFTRVKAPNEFRSNAGAIARKNIPGTGEGYAIFYDG